MPDMVETVYELTGNVFREVNEVHPLTGVVRRPFGDSYDEKDTLGLVAAILSKDLEMMWYYLNRIKAVEDCEWGDLVEPEALRYLALQRGKKI